eukprot:1405310-Lingulodinium_polyedra.AAC.1
MHPQGRFPGMVRAAALTGRLSAELAAEAQLLALIPTAEQRAEEVHAKIHKINLLRVCDPPTVSARLREKENISFLSSAQALLFTAHIWNRYSARRLLELAMDAEACWAAG